MTFHDRSTSWFLAQLKPNSAKIAEMNLRRQGFRTFLPLEEVTRQRNGKFVTVSRPVFPGYIFVSFNAARGLWRSVNATYGVSRLVSFGNEPAPVPTGIISELMLRCDASDLLRPSRLLEPGDRVRLNTGPFASFVGEIETVTPDRRAFVLMDIMGGQTRISVGAEQVRGV